MPLRSAGAWVMGRIRRTPATEPAIEPVPLTRGAKPIALVDVVQEGTRRKVERADRQADRSVEKPVEAPPPIIRGPERKPEPAKKPKRIERQEELFAEDSYRLPTLGLLDPPTKTTAPIDEATLLTSSRILENKLADFGVAGKVVAVRPGPVITTFEFEPAPGVKVNRIVNLADDLTMALRAASVRILAPIPGKPVVGIEVSNPRRETVFIRELIDERHVPAAPSRSSRWRSARTRRATAMSPTWAGCRIC